MEAKTGMKQRSRSDSQAWGKGDAYKALEKRLEGLELGIDKIESASGGTVLDQCGDACMQAGARERAVEYYGESIDAHLNEGYQELARGVAQKLIRVHPEGVRVFCTLTWIELGLGYLADAQMQLRAYVVAACRFQLALGLTPAGTWQRHTCGRWHEPWTPRSSGNPRLQRWRNWGTPPLRPGCGQC